MKIKKISKKFILLFVAMFFLFLMGLGFYFSDSNFRGLASFSEEELEYAEDFLLGEKKPEDSELNVHPQWKDDLKRKRRLPDTIQQRLEKELQADYEKNLLKDLKKKTGKEPIRTNLERHLEMQGEQVFEAASLAKKKELAETLVENAKRDGYEVILDEYYEVLSVKKISE